MENEVYKEDRPQLVLTDVAENMLVAAARWATFLGVLAFVFAGIAVLQSVMLVVGGAIMASMANMPFPPVYLGLFSFLVAAVYVLVGYFLTAFGTKCKKALLYRSVNDLEMGMGHLKSHFMTMGIFAIVFLSLLMVLVMVAIVAGFMTAL